MKAKLIRMQVAVKEAGPVLKSFFEDLKVRNAFDPHDPDFEETFNRILQGYFNGFRAVATLVTHFRAGNESQKISKSGLEELNQLFRKFDTEFSQFRSRKEKWIATLNLLHHAVKEVLETKETKDSMPGLIGDALEAVAARRSRNRRLRKRMRRLRPSLIARPLPRLRRRWRTRSKRRWPNRSRTSLRLKLRRSSSPPVASETRARCRSR